MKIQSFGKEESRPITEYGSINTSSVALGHGTGDSHAYTMYFEANSEIGPHPTNFCQLFLVINGAGWVAGADGTKIPITSGQSAFFKKGELHSKGSETGMTAIMMQSANIIKDIEQ